LRWVDKTRLTGMNRYIHAKMSQKMLKM